MWSLFLFSKIKEGIKKKYFASVGNIFPENVQMQTVEI